MGPVSMTLIASSPEKDLSVANETHENPAKTGTDTSTEGNAQAAIPEDAFVSSVFIGQKPVLKNWKIHAGGPQMDDDVRPSSQADEDAALEAEMAAFTNIAPERNFSDRRIAVNRPVAPVWLQVAQALAVFLTVAWITYAAIYIVALPGGVKAITSSSFNCGE